MNRKNWIYRVLQILFVLAIAGPTFGKLTQNEQFLQRFTGVLGYPVYLSRILAVAYLLGMVGIFQTKSALLKEWAYAGFTFALIGAFFSHLLAGDAFVQSTWALLTLGLMLGAYFLEKKARNSKE